MRFLDVHFFDDDEIIVHGDHDIDEPGRNQDLESFLDRRDKDVEFADEARQRWYPRQRQ